MADILHRIGVDAPPEKVYEAVRSSEGLKSWWTRDSASEARPGGRATFGFHKRATVFQMRYEALDPAKRVVWACEGGPDEWVGTKVCFDLEPGEGGGTVVRFAHRDWRSTEGAFPDCNTVWGYLMHSLKSHCEGGKPGPYFEE
jgi:uncharacterized protein YndB with AHSA1/START domain